MDSETQRRISETVMEILRSSDMQEMTEYKVRKQAADRLAIDLSQPSRKKFVRQVVESFLQEQQAAQAQAQAQAQAHQNQNDAAEEEEEQQEEEEDSTTRPSDAKEYDEEGDLILCKLSEKRRVTLQDFKGRTLVSIREYYKKDGKFLPTSKGISLTAEQWSNFRKNVPAIEKAIQKLEGRLN